MKFSGNKFELYFLRILMLVWIAISCYIFTRLFVEVCSRIYTKYIVPPYSGKFVVLLFAVSLANIIISLAVFSRLKSKKISAWSIGDERSLRFEHDKPTELDELGYDKFVNMLVAAIKGSFADPNATQYIGLFAKWGAGKTSIVKMAKRSLRESGARVRFVDFNPWSTRHSDSLSDELMKVLAECLDDNKTISRSTLRLFGWKFSRSGLGSTLQMLPSVGDFFKALIGWFSDVNEIKNKLNDELAKIASDYRIVVIIDDVDRLSSEEIVELIKLIKSDADFKNITYLVVADDGYLASAIDDYVPSVGNDDFGSGRNFLEKIFPVELHVPMISEAILLDKGRSYVNSVISEFVENGETIDLSKWLMVKPYFANMRTVKRFANVLKSRLYCFVDGQKRRVSVDVNDYVVLTALSLFEKDFYEAIYRNRDILVTGTAEVDYENRCRYSSSELANIFGIDPNSTRWERLFGFVRAYLGWDKETGVSPSNDRYLYSLSEDELLDAEANFRLCSPRWFDEYFACGVDVADLITVDEYDRLNKACPSVNQVIAVLLDFHKKGRLQKLLQGLYSRPLPKQKHHIAALLKALIVIGDYALRAGEQTHPPVWIKPELSDLHDWINQTFQEVLTKTYDDLQGRENETLSMLKECGSCYILAKLLRNPNHIIANRNEEFKVAFVENVLAAMHHDAFWNSPTLAFVYSAFTTIVRRLPMQNEYIARFREVTGEKQKEYRGLSYVLSTFVANVAEYPYNTIPALMLDFSEAECFLNMDIVMQTLSRADKEGVLPVEWLTVLAAMEQNKKEASGCLVSGLGLLKEAMRDASVVNRIEERRRHSELNRGFRFNECS